MRTFKNKFRILINKLLIVIIWFIMLIYFCGLSIIPISSMYILYAISCVVVVYGGCWFMHLLDEANKKIRNRN